MGATAASTVLLCYFSRRIRAVWPVNRYGVGERNDQVRVIVIGHQAVRAEVRYLMAGRAELAE